MASGSGSSRSLPPELEEYCPQSGKPHALLSVREFCGKCGQKNPSFVPPSLNPGLNDISAHQSTAALAAQGHASMAPREVSVPERNRNGRSPAEILRQQGMVRRSRAIVTSPNAGAPALSMRSNAAISAVVGQTINELEVDLTVWNCNYYSDVLPSGLCAKKTTLVEKFGNTIRIFLKDKPFTTIEDHIRDDMLSQWPQERTQTNFDSQEVSLAHDVYPKTNDLVRASINPQEIRTFFELITKFNRVGSAKARRYAIHVVLDNMTLGPAPGISDVSDQSKSKTPQGDGQKAKSSREGKAFDKKDRKKGYMSTTDDSDSESWLNSPSPTAKSKSTKDSRGKRKAKSTRSYLADNSIIKDEPLDDFSIPKQQSPSSSMFLSTRDPLLEFKEEILSGLQADVPIYISSDSEELPSLEELFAQGAIPVKGKKQTRHNESKTDLKPEASQESMSTSEGLIIKREAQLATSYKKPIWKSPPKPIWWSPEGSSKDVSEDFEKIVEQDKAAREQIAARERAEESSKSRSKVQAAEAHESESDPSEDYQQLDMQASPDKNDTDSVVLSKSSRLGSQNRIHLVDAIKEEDNSQKGSLTALVAETGAVVAKGSLKLEEDLSKKKELSETSSIAHGRASSKKTSRREYPNVQTRLSKKTSETPPPEGGSESNSRTLRSGGKGKGRKG